MTSTTNGRHCSWYSKLIIDNISHLKFTESRNVSDNLAFFTFRVIYFTFRHNRSFVRNANLGLKLIKDTAANQKNLGATLFSYVPKTENYPWDKHISPSAKDHQKCIMVAEQCPIIQSGGRYFKKEYEFYWQIIYSECIPSFEILRFALLLTK